MKTYSFDSSCSRVDAEKNHSYSHRGRLVSGLVCNSCVYVIRVFLAVYIGIPIHPIAFDYSWLQTSTVSLSRSLHHHTSCPCNINNSSRTARTSSQCPSLPLSSRLRTLAIQVTMTPQWRTQSHQPHCHRRWPPPRLRFPLLNPYQHNS